ncbi:unnamed protein product [Caenorhabditis brenneri]
MRATIIAGLVLLLGAYSLQMALVPIQPRKVSPGYSVFERPSRIIVTHRFHEESVTYEEAEKICDAEGASLSGITSMDEADFLKGLIKPANSEGQYWIGGRRNPSCFHVKGFVDKSGDPCSRENVVTWQNNVAKTIKEGWWRDHRCDKKDCVKIPNPSSEIYEEGKGKKGVQSCLGFVSGSPSWSDKNSSQFLDDKECDSTFQFFCQKPLIASYRLFTNPVTPIEAEEKCKETGGLLAGINTEKDAVDIAELAKEAGSVNGLFWLGATRKPSCFNVSGYIDEIGHPCSRENVMMWTDGVGTRVKSSWWRDHYISTVKNPSSNSGQQDGDHGFQRCLVFVSGSHQWAADNFSQFLDDTECNQKRGFVCAYF